MAQRLSTMTTDNDNDDSHMTTMTTDKGCRRWRQVDIRRRRRNDNDDRPNVEIRKHVICDMFRINNSTNYTFQISAFRKVLLPTCHYAHYVEFSLTTLGPCSAVPAVGAAETAGALVIRFKVIHWLTTYCLYADKFTRLFYLLMQLVRAANYGRWCRWRLQSDLVFQQ